MQRRRHAFIQGFWLAFRAREKGQKLTQSSIQKLSEEATREAQHRTMLQESTGQGDDWQRYQVTCFGVCNMIDCWFEQQPDRYRNLSEMIPAQRLRYAQDLAERYERYF